MLLDILFLGYITLSAGIFRRKDMATKNSLSLNKKDPACAAFT